MPWRTEIESIDAVPVKPLHQAMCTLTSILRASAAQFMYDRWANQPCHVEVMVEKDALSGVLLPVCAEMDVLFTANKGYSSASYMYETGKRLLEHARRGREVHVIYLGDHDPSGLDMSRDIADRLSIFMDGAAVEVHRIALNMDQVEQYNPPENPAKTTDSRYADYATKFGSRSWELDALEPAVLAGLVRDTIRVLIDDGAWAVSLAKQTEARDHLTRMANDWEAGH
jgi:hypothetical protein